MKPNQKLSISIKCINSNDIAFISKGFTRKSVGENIILEQEFPAGDINFSIDLDDLPPGQAIVISSIKLNAVDLTTGIDKFGAYTTKNNKRKLTYGYMDEPGAYSFKLRSNAMYMYYFNYLIGITK